MAASEAARFSADAERKLESALPHDPKPKRSSGLHPAFYIA